MESRLSEESCRKEATFLHDEVRAKSAELHQLQKLVLDSANEKEEEIVRLREIHQEQVGCCVCRSCLPANEITMAGLLKGFLVGR